MDQQEVRLYKNIYKEINKMKKLEKQKQSQPMFSDAAYKLQEILAKLFVGKEGSDST